MAPVPISSLRGPSPPPAVAVKGHHAHDSVTEVDAVVPAINASMRAVRFHGKGDLRLEDIPVQRVGRDQVKVRPAWVGICGSDLHEYMGGPNLCPTTPHPITGETVPLTFGHEFSGVVEEVGSDVTTHKIGDRVAIQPIIYDGTCGACQEGYINCCYSNGFIGLSGWGGGLSDHSVVPATSAIPLPAAVPLEVGALIEPLAVGWHAVKLSPFKPGDAVLVLGGGPIGLSVIQALRAKGATKIIVSEVSRRRQQFAQQFGAHFVLDPTRDDVVKRCREMCENQGVHVVFDCAGVQAGLDTAIQATRARGTIVNIAVWGKPCTINPGDIMFKEKTYVGVATYVAGDFEEVMNAIAEGHMDPSGMITKKIELDEVEEKGFHTLIHDKDNHVKVIVKVAPPAAS